MRLKIWVFKMLLLAFVFSACQLPAPVSPLLKGNKENSANNIYQELWKKIQSKEPYKGPIQVSLNPGLLHAKQSIPIKSLTNEFEKSFRIQSSQNSPIVFQEDFYQKGEYLREFDINDTSQRYTLIVERHQKSTQIEININGNTWIKPVDFDNKTAEKNTLLLNARNKMRIRIQGKSGNVVSVSLIEGGEVGTILKRQGKLNNKRVNQATHIKNNDVNLFNPNFPEALGDLEAYQKDITVVSASDGAKISFSGMQANDGPIIRFETGSLVVAFKDEEAGKNVLSNYYGATLTDEFDGFYKFQLDLEKSPVNNLVQLIRSLNEKGENTVTDVAFSSFGSLQTFVLRAPNKTKSITS